MAGKRPRRRSNCPTAYALDLFGDRWTLLVIRDLMFNRRRRFSDFLGAEEGIASNILSDRLARLEACGIVAASTDPEDRRRKRYRLAPKGVDLAPLMVEMILWSAKYDAQTAASKAFVNKARRDRKGLLREIVSELDDPDSPADAQDS
jgi:DNA-binding HxlR family transcriptional regulator